MKIPLFRVFSLCSIACGLLLSSLTFAADMRVGVIYPEVNQPYARVFQQIISGIKQKNGFDVATYALSEQYDSESIKLWITGQKVQALVALGQRGVDVAGTLNVSIPVIVGAVLYVPQEQNQTVTGISLTPAPDLLFKQLKQLAPHVKRIQVVYNPDRYQWLIDYATIAAKKLDIEVFAKQARDLPSAAPLYRQLLSDSHQDFDAIWLLQDSSTVGNSSILPLVLKEAWDKKLVVFSSNPGHVRRGALFSLYADETALGNSIIELVLLRTLGKAPKGLLPLNDVHVAVNLRTAGHINIDIPYEKRRQFDLVFPQR